MGLIYFFFYLVIHTTNIRAYVATQQSGSRKKEAVCGESSAYNILSYNKRQITAYLAYMLGHANLLTPFIWTQLKIRLFP